jgi:hypothetical protein
MRPLTKSQAVCLTVMTGTLMLNPKDFREAIEKKLGRVVAAPEFAEQAFTAELQQLYAEEYEKLLDLVEDSGLMLLR